MLGLLTKPVSEPSQLFQVPSVAPTLAVFKFHSVARGASSISGLYSRPYKSRKLGGVAVEASFSFLQLQHGQVLSKGLDVSIGAKVLR